jgi:outer membrane lipoprotein-sorting protein
MPVDEGFLSGAAFQFLLGEGDILESFDVGAVDCEAPVVRLVLRPRAPSTYQVLEIRTDPATGDVRGTAVEDLFGNRTEVDFQELKTNPELAAGLFAFEPPEGVRVEALQPLVQPPGARK